LVVKGRFYALSLFKVEAFVDLDVRGVLVEAALALLEEAVFVEEIVGCFVPGVVRTLHFQDDPFDAGAFGIDSGDGSVGKGVGQAVEANPGIGAGEEGWGGFEEFVSDGEAEGVDGGGFGGAGVDERGEEEGQEQG
jgi:hypothetical protein